MKLTAGSSRRLFVLALVAAVAIALLAAAGCSPSEAKDKAVLSAALARFDASAAPLALTMQSADQDSTVAPDGQPVAMSLKAARDKIAPDWQRVIDAAQNVEGAGTRAARKAWADLDAAIDVVPPDATVGQAAGIISLPLTELLQAEADLWAAVKATN